MKRLIVGALVVTVGGCFFPADRGRIVESRLDALGDENAKLKSALKETQGQLDDTAVRLKAALEQLDAASRTTGANMGVKLDQALQDVAQLRGNLESLQYKVIDLESRNAAASSSVPSEKKPDEVKKPEEPKKPDEPKPFLALADEKAKAGDVDGARRLYTEFMRRWPRDEAMGEAHFGLGESFFSDKKCREALYEYGKVIQDHAKSKSAASAYLRSAECFSELKMADESKLALQELVKQFPKSDAAKTAKSKLSELEKKGKKK